MYQATVDYAQIRPDGRNELKKPNQEQLVERYLDLVYFFANRFLSSREEVDDTVNETFLRAFRAYPDFRYRSEGELKSWLLTICRNAVADAGRCRLLLFAGGALPEPEHPGFEERLLEQTVQDEQLESIFAAIRDLPAVDQELIRLKLAEDMTFKEIADVFGIHDGAVKMRYYRILRRLREVAS